MFCACVSPWLVVGSVCACSNRLGGDRGDLTEAGRQYTILLSKFLRCAAALSSMKHHRANMELAEGKGWVVGVVTMLLWVVWWAGKSWRRTSGARTGGRRARARA